MHDRRDWPGLAAVVLALSLGLGWGTSLILANTPWTDDLSQHGTDLLNGIGQVLAGALATFLGVSTGTRAAAQATPEPGVEPSVDDEDAYYVDPDDELEDDDYDDDVEPEPPADTPRQP